MFGANVLLNFRARYVTDIAVALVELADFVGIGIEPEDDVAGFSKSQTQRQPYIAASDHSDF